jgi:hypothetical protein
VQCFEREKDDPLSHNRRASYRIIFACQSMVVVSSTLCIMRTFFFVSPDPVSTTLHLGRVLGSPVHRHRWVSKQERKKERNTRMHALCACVVRKEEKKKPRKQRRETETCNRNPMPLPNGPRHSSGLSRTAWIRLHDTDFCVYFTVIVTTGSIGRSQAKAKKLTIFAVASKPT